MSKNNLMIIAVVLVLLVGGYFLMNSASDTTPTPAVNNNNVVMDDDDEEDVDDEADSMMLSSTVVLTPDDTNTEVAQSGTMTLKETDEGVVATLTVTGYESTVPQPAHIHAGTCPDVEAVVYPLEDVVDGTSVTTLEGVTLADLAGELPLGVNVHKSAEEVSVYTACGNLDL